LKELVVKGISDVKMDKQKKPEEKKEEKPILKENS
jgi:hypothetical protein